MEETVLKTAIANNIAFYRKLAGHTQLELAEKLNYSDKSVSKWERAEGLPDVSVLMQIAELYGVTLNDLVSLKPPRPRKRRNAMVILLSLGLVWLVATVAFVALMLICPDLSRRWLSFLYALPVCSILLVVFASLSGSWWQKGLSVSLLIWTLALCIHLTIQRPYMPLIYLVGAALQVLTVLWFVYRARK